MPLQEHEVAAANASEHRREVVALPSSVPHGCLPVATPPAMILSMQLLHFNFILLQECAVWKKATLYHHRLRRH